MLAFRCFRDSAAATLAAFLGRRRAEQGESASLLAADVLNVLSESWRDMGAAARETFLSPARALLQVQAAAAAAPAAATAVAGRKRALSEVQGGDGPDGGGSDGREGDSPGGGLSVGGSAFLQSPGGAGGAWNRKVGTQYADVPAWDMDGVGGEGLMAARPRPPQVTDACREGIAADGLAWSTTSLRRRRCAGEAPRLRAHDGEGDSEARQQPHEHDEVEAAEEAEEAEEAKAEAELSLFLAAADRCIVRHQHRRKTASRGAAHELTRDAADAALAALHEHGYDAAAALDAIAGEAFASAVLAEWTPEEQREMWGAFATHGDDLAKVVAAMAPQKDRRAVVEYYFRNMYGAVQLQSDELADAPALHALSADAAADDDDDDGSTDGSNGDDADDGGGTSEGDDEGDGVRGQAEAAFVQRCRAALDAAAFDRLADVLQGLKKGGLRTTAVAAAVQHLLQQGAGDHADALYREFVAFLPAAAGALSLRTQ